MRILFSITLLGLLTSLSAQETITYPYNPDSDGDADQVLKTDGSGTLSWGTASSSVDGLTDGKSGGPNFTNSIIIGHQTTGTLSSAERNTAVGIAAMDAMTTRAITTTSTS